MTSPASTSPRSWLDAALPAALTGHERHRARFLVGAGVLLLLGYAVGGAYIASTGQTGSTLLVALAAALTAGSLAGFRLGWWGREQAAWGLFPTAVVGLIANVWAGFGLEAPDLVWLGVVPVAAALVGGRWHAAVSAALAAVGVGVLWLQGGLEPSGAQAFTAVNLTAAALLSAWLGRFHKATTEGALAEQRARLSHLTEALRASGLRSLDFYGDPSDREGLLEGIRDEGSKVVEVDARDAQGRPLRLRIHARARRGASGEVIGIEGVVEDISAEHRVRTEAEAREARFRALVQHAYASDVICVLDRDGRITYASPSLRSATGVDPEGARGASILDLLHPEDVDRALATFCDAEAPTTGAEFRLRHVDGHHLFAEAIATPLYDDPAVGGLVATFREITDRKRAEAVLVRAKEQAEEVAQLKSTFLANMSHEIRTPLTGILGFADILSDEVTDPEQKEFVDLILRSGRRLLDTLNSVLDLARLDAGRMELTSEPVRIGEAVEEAVGLLAPLADEKGIALAADVEDPYARSEVDPGALHRILTNLVGNAIKFTDEGSVTVGVRSDAQRVVLEVKDTGVGIDAEFLPHLFEEFKQESAGAGRSHEGSGLGLAISRQLAERMEGTIAVASVKGEGSTFTVTFPRADAVPLPAEPRRSRVLVVDDNEMTRSMAARMLESAYRVDTAAGPSEAEALALDAARSDDAYDVLLLDINLGTMDTGEDVMRHLREHAPYDARPIIAFTAYALPGDRERFLAGGFDGYFSKPFTRDTLLEAVANALDPEREAKSTMIVRNRTPRREASGRIVLVPGVASE